MIAATATLLLFGAVAPAVASNPTSDAHQTAASTPLPEGSDEHYAGSQIMKHEGRSGSPDPRVASVTQTHGMDVSGWQGTVDWNKAARDGAHFSYVKATEGTGFRNKDFAHQYNGSYNAGLIRGAYHFALPDRSNGATQAKFFVSNGGGWSADGKTLPPALDIEYNPYGNTCYGLSQSQMVTWIRDFSNEVHRLTSRYPTIYTSTSWWQTCTGNNGSFGATNPLWVARYAGSVGTLPNGWGFQTIWQYSDSGIFPGDQNWFNGAPDRLKALANG
ncbi:lysozyme [Actinoalloteichus hymeniacidonis]